MRFVVRASAFIPIVCMMALGIAATSAAAYVIERVSVSSDGSQGNGGSGEYVVSINADGRYVAFTSFASNLVPGDTNGYMDVFVHDRQTGQTTRVSVASDGTQANGRSADYPRSVSLSADGRYVAFSSYANTLVAGDTNGYWDVFVYDRQTGQTTRVSVASNGAQGTGHSGLWGVAISADGRYVAFQSDASNLVPGDTNGLRDVFVALNSAWDPCASDTTPPVITCTDQTIAIPPPACAASCPAVATATDTCDPTPVVTQSPDVGACLPLGAHTVTATGTDASGNTATCTATVTVVTGGTQVTLASPGWHIIAQPHHGDHALRDSDPAVTVSKDGGPPVPFCDAVSAGWLQSPLYYYDDSPTGGGYLSAGCDPWDDSALREGKGYWLMTLEPNITLIFP